MFILPKILFLLKKLMKPCLTIYYTLFLLNHSPASKNLSAIFIEKERLKWYFSTEI